VGPLLTVNSQQLVNIQHSHIHTSLVLLVLAEERRNSFYLRVRKLDRSESVSSTELFVLLEPKSTWIVSLTRRTYRSKSKLAVVSHKHFQTSTSQSSVVNTKLVELAEVSTSTVELHCKFQPAVAVRRRLSRTVLIAEA